MPRHQQPGQQSRSDQLKRTRAKLVPHPKEPLDSEVFLSELVWVARALTNAKNASVASEAFYFPPYPKEAQWTGA